MNKLIYACPYGRDRSTSWSGIHASLYNALQEHFDMVDVPTAIWGHGIWSWPIAISNKIHHKIFGDDMDEWRLSIMKNYVHKHCNTGAPVFQFDYSPWNVKGLQYVYQDLSAVFVQQMETKYKDIFPVSNFGNVPIDVRNERGKKERKFYDNVAGIFTMGMWLKKWLIEDLGIPKEKVHHAGGGCNIDMSLIDDGIREKGMKILYVGKDFERKNGPLVVKAFHLLHERRPEAELFIAGPSDMPAGCDMDGIHFIGLRSFKELAPYYNMCNIFCMPSLFEAYGLVFVEAMVFGLPCIGRDAFEMPYFIDEGNTGLLLRHQDAGELSQLMERAADDNDMVSRVLAQRADYCKKYSWSSVAKRISDAVYADIDAQTSI